MNTFEITYHLIRYNDKSVLQEVSPSNRMTFYVDDSGNPSLGIIKNSKKYAVVVDKHIYVFCLSMSSIYNHLRRTSLHYIERLIQQRAIANKCDLLNWQIAQEEMLGRRIAETIVEWLSDKKISFISFGDSHGDAMLFRIGIELYYRLTADTICLGDILYPRNDKWFGNFRKEVFKDENGNDVFCEKYSLMRDIRDVYAMKMLKEVNNYSRRQSIKFIILKGNHDKDNRVEELHTKYDSPLIYMHNILYSKSNILFQHGYIPKKHEADICMKSEGWYEAHIDYISYFHLRYRDKKSNCAEESARDIEARTMKYLHAVPSIVIVGHEMNSFHLATNVAPDTILPIPRDIKLQFPRNAHDVTPFGTSLFQRTLPLDGMDGTPDWDKETIHFNDL